MTTPRADLDSPWKDILRAYLPQGIEFFFPDLSCLINWERSPEFLDKEFQQIAKDSDVGRRFADQLIKVWLKDGDELWLLLHLEVQAHREQNFSARMFTYSLRIYDRFGRTPVSLAILCDDNQNWRPNRHRVELPYTVHDFEFGIVKLLDYGEQWAELESSDNPFSTVVMAHLKMQETKPDEQQRKRWKLGLIRGLYDRGYERQEIIDLYRFIDWIMILPEELEQECWNELKAFEEQRKMTYVTTGERIGYERGRQEEGCSILLGLLKRKLGDLPPDIETQIQSLNIEEIERLSESILDFTEISDLESWLSDR